MKDEINDLMQKYFEAKCGKPLLSLKMGWLTQQQALDALKQLHDVFKARYSRIARIAYRASLESAADEAIRRFAFDPASAPWKTLPLPVWRVLLERYMQAISVITVNLAALDGLKWLPVPVELQPDDRLGAVMLFYLHGMELPSPVTRVRP